MTNVVFFNWPSPIGGADTKQMPIYRLLAPHYRLRIVPNSDKSLEQKHTVSALEKLGVEPCPRHALPHELDGWAISICNRNFFGEGLVRECKERGMRTAFSNSMMWHFEAERGGIALGLLDTILYNSEAQRTRLEPGFLEVTRGRLAPPSHFPELEAAGESGWLQRRDGGPPVRWVITDNYVEPADFPFRPPQRRRGEPFVIGRLSRPDPVKFPPNFPQFYEGLGLEAPVRFRVMGWNDRMAGLWPDHSFDTRWNLVPPLGESTKDFLASLDVMVYSLSDRFRESWGRAVVEGMLTGVVPLVPKSPEHHLATLVPHGVAGFHCENDEEYGHYARLLQRDRDLLEKMSHAARHHAEFKLGDGAEHLRRWRLVLDEPPRQNS